jgi:hypothetical protein
VVGLLGHESEILLTIEDFMDREAFAARTQLATEVTDVAIEDSDSTINTTPVSLLVNSYEKYPPLTRLTY